jgi:hypothetical protein
MEVIAKGKFTDGTNHIPGKIVKYGTNILSFRSDDGRTITGTTIKKGKLEDSEKYNNYKFESEDGKTLNENNELVQIRRGGKKSKKSKRKSNKKRNNKTKRRK